MKKIEPKIRLALLSLCFFIFSIAAPFHSTVHAADPAGKLSEITRKLKSKLQSLTEVKKEEKSIVSKNRKSKQ